MSLGDRCKEVLETYIVEEGNILKGDDWGSLSIRLNLTYGILMHMHMQQRERRKLYNLKMWLTNMWKSLSSKYEKQKKAGIDNLIVQRTFIKFQVLNYRD